MPIDVTVANLALSKLGEEDQIRDPDQDSHAARSVRAVWDPIRRAVLRTGKFNFALTSAELAAQNLATLPAKLSPYPFKNRFPVPSDCLRLIEVIEPTSIRDKYRYRRGAILADTDGPVFILYAADIAEAALWDVLFVEAFASRLAFQIADRITGDRGRKLDAWQSYRRAIKDAAGVDAKEDPPEETPDSSWITARLG